MMTDRKSSETGEPSPGHHPPEHHHHAHSHHGHDHAIEVTEDSQRRVFWAMFLTGGFMLAEVAGGILSGSLALIADAGHMLSDFVSLLLAWLAFRLSKRKADLRRTYGYHRFQVLAAFVNGLSLLAIAVWIVIEALRRFFDPVEVLAGPMLIVAALGLLVNLLAFWLLMGGNRDNLNMKGALAHVIGDLLGSVAAIAASVIILLTGWMPADPVLSLLVAVIILRTGYGVVRRAGHILLEGAPEEVDPQAIRDGIVATVPAAIDVHHIHIWSLTNERPVLTLHVRVAPEAHNGTTLMAVHRALKERFGIDHATVQLEDESCSDHL